MPDGGGPRLPQLLGWSLLWSSAVALIGAIVNDARNSEVVIDDLGNESMMGNDVTLLLVVLGIILAVNGIVLLVWDRVRR